jgi:hypothetical protein
MHFYFYLYLSTLASLCYSFLITLKMLELYYPNEYNNIKIKMFWFFLKISIISNTSYEKIKNTLYNAIYGKKDVIKYNITFINEGIEVDNIKTNDFNLIKTPNSEYEIILYNINLSDDTNNNSTQITNSRECVYFFTDKLVESEDFFKKIKMSSVKLLAPQIHVGNVKIPIKLKDLTIYYENTILFWNKFATWYLTYIDPLDQNECDDIDLNNYSISFIDDQMNLIRLNKNESILLKEETYTTTINLTKTN